jgi:hypothetical protein
MGEIKHMEKQFDRDFFWGAPLRKLVWRMGVLRPCLAGRQAWRVGGRSQGLVASGWWLECGPSYAKAAAGRGVGEKSTARSGCAT